MSHLEQKITVTQHGFSVWDFVLRIVNYNWELVVFMLI